MSTETVASKQVMLRVPPLVWERLQKIAEKMGSKPSSHAAYLLQRAIDEQWEREGLQEDHD